MEEIEFVDVTMRDGHQSLWATRMTTAMMADIAPRLDRAGFEAIDLAGGAAEGAFAHVGLATSAPIQIPWSSVSLSRRPKTLVATGSCGSAPIRARSSM